MKKSRIIKIAPSILSADFTRLGEQIAEINKANADYIHVDVMDGHFVPNITIGPLVVKSIRKITKIPLDVHLMISNPINYISDFYSSGADIITVHIEADIHIHRLIEYIKSLGIRAGIALNPGTNVNSIEEVISIVDIVLVMTVDPGFGGQKFIETSYGKIEKVRKMIDSKDLNTEIAVDGGIIKNIARKVSQSGADILIAGNAIFSQSNISRAIEEIKEEANSTS